MVLNSRNEVWKQKSTRETKHFVHARSDFASKNEQQTKCDLLFDHPVYFISYIWTRRWQNFIISQIYSNKSCNCNPFPFKWLSENCQLELWRSVYVSVMRVKRMMGFSDCVHNLSIVHNFLTSDSYLESCSNAEPWLLGIEELIYPTFTMKPHVLNALAQLHLTLQPTPPHLTLQNIAKPSGFHLFIQYCQFQQRLCS